MWAKNLCGDHVGKRIEWAKVSPTDDGRFDVQWNLTDEVTMILHKKNGRVHVRYGRNNRQLNLAPDVPIREAEDERY